MKARRGWKQPARGKRPTRGKLQVQPARGPPHAHAFSETASYSRSVDELSANLPSILADFVLLTSQRSADKPRQIAGPLLKCLATFFQVGRPVVGASYALLRRSAEVIEDCLRHVGLRKAQLIDVRCE